MENLCENLNNDLRQILNFLEMWSKKSKNLQIKDIQNE